MARHARLSGTAALLALPALAGCFAAVVPIADEPERPAASAPPRSIGASAFAAPWDAVSFEMLSWGYPVSSWRLSADGSGSWSQAERDARAPLGRYRLAWHELAADAQRASRLRSAIEALPFPAPSSEDCGQFMTDQPYGRLRLEKGASVLELTYNAGCLDDAYQRFLDGLHAADTLVAQAGRAAPASRYEEHGAEN